MGAMMIDRDPNNDAWENMKIWRAAKGKTHFAPFNYFYHVYQWRIQDFPEEGAPTLGGRQHTILPNFPKNCMKLKEFGPPGGRVQNFTM